MGGRNRCRDCATLFRVAVRRNSSNSKECALTIALAKPPPAQCFCQAQPTGVSRERIVLDGSTRTRNFVQRTVRVHRLLGESVVWIFHRARNCLAIGTVRNLVEHIVQVEEFFASRLLGQEPAEKPKNSGLPGLLQLHKDANAKLETFLNASDDDKLRDTQTLGGRRVSNRKMLAQAALHSVHHWAQVAMEVRPAGFPTGKPQDFIITDLIE